MKRVFYYLLALLAIIITIADSCRKSDAKSSTASTILSSITTIDVNSDFKGTNFVNLFTANKNVLIVSGKDTLCYAVGLTKNDKFISYNDQTGEQNTTFTATQMGNTNTMVITATPHSAYINGGFKGKITNVALFNAEQSPNALRISAYANPTAIDGIHAEATKGVIIKNSKMSVYVVRNADTGKHTSTSNNLYAQLENDVEDDVTPSIKIGRPLIHSATGPVLPPAIKNPFIPKNPTPEEAAAIRNFLDVYKYINLEDNSSKKEGSAGNTVGDYYKRGAGGYLEFYHAVFSMENAAKVGGEGWQYLGPFPWISSEPLAQVPGAIYFYNNPFNKRRELFRLKKYPYSWFPTNKTSNESWEYLGEDSSSTITIKLWYSQDANAPISHEIEWAWNNFIEAMGYVTNSITYIRSYQGSLSFSWNLKNSYVEFKKYLNTRYPNKEKFTIYGFLRWDGDWSCGGLASNTYFQGKGGPTMFPACFIAATNAFMLNVMGHEIGHVLGALHNDAVYWRQWWWIFGIWHHDIMGSGNGGYLNFAEHRLSLNIDRMKDNLRETR